ncbi:hypothetical protein [Microbacterium sp. NPDC091662]|uniref:hypothetical protein n=1 Tax=Microbacterium sp. NPDC091662 TaxID=3364211 RepID=UPI0037FD6D9C
MTSQNFVQLNISDNEGYAPDQVGSTMTLGALLESLQDAVDEFGEDATVVVANGQRYGAGYGKLRVDRYGEVFSRPAAEDDEF